ncbi:unnamed protein product [Penicillium salamii]|nr:unnamed protein product [Penicillium salamii]
MMSWIIKELQWKADSLHEKGFIRAFDVGVVKSDSAISSSLREELKRAAALFENLLEDQKDFHPGSNQKVVNLIHPSLFPVIFGRTHVLPQRTIGLEDCLGSIGHGSLVPIPPEEDTNLLYDEESGASRRVGMRRPQIRQVPFSRKFQWLPCDVDFTEDSNSEASVDNTFPDENREERNSENATTATNGCQIKSYINNAHPATHRGLYGVIEKIITATIPLWDESLTKRKYGGARIPYKKVEYGEHPQPEPTQTYPDNPEDEGEDEDEEFEERYWKWLQSRPIIQPEPGEFKVIEANERDRMNLREKFAETGLQVIVKLANIELMPENPDYEGGAWHIEGQLVSSPFRFLNPCDLNFG